MMELQKKEKLKRDERIKVRPLAFVSSVFVSGTDVSGF
jgi:hypothetical protein